MPEIRKFNVDIGEFYQLNPEKDFTKISRIPGMGYGWWIVSVTPGDLGRLGEIEAFEATTEEIFSDTKLAS